MGAFGDFIRKKLSEFGFSKAVPPIRDGRLGDSSADAVSSVSEANGDSLPFRAAHASDGMLVYWLLRVVQHDSSNGFVVELYDGETGELVADYHADSFCDNSGKRKGQGLACRGYERRYRIAYDDLLAMQSLVRAEIEKDDRNVVDTSDKSL